MHFLRLLRLLYEVRSTIFRRAKRLRMVLFYFHIQHSQLQKKQDTILTYCSLNYLFHHPSRQFPYIPRLERASQGGGVTHLLTYSLFAE